MTADNESRSHNSTESASAAPAKPQDPPAHLEGVDGLRGLAALAIVVYHTFTAAFLPAFRVGHINILRPFHDGWAAVNLFLILSGFCLYWPYARRPSRHCHYIGFMQNRARRIVPAYYASLILIPAAFCLMVRAGIPTNENYRPFGLCDTILHLLLLHSLSPVTLRTWSGVTWSLGLEWTWYLAFPLAVWLFRRAGVWRGFAILSAITLAYRFGLYFGLGPARHFSDDTYTMWLRVLLPARLLEFGLGMVVASLLANSYRPGHARQAALFRFPGTAFALSLLMIAVAHGCLVFDVFLPWIDLSYGLAFALLIVAVVDPSRGLVQRAFSSRLLDGIGQCSYSLFLLHLPIVNGVSGLFHLHGIVGPRNFLFSLIALVPSILVARLSYRFIEAPFLRRAQIARIAAPEDSSRPTLATDAGSTSGVCPVES